jgi:hypothetical protein
LRLLVLFGLLVFVTKMLQAEWHLRTREVLDWRSAMSEALIARDDFPFIMLNRREPLRYALWGAKFGEISVPFLLELNRETGSDR